MGILDKIQDQLDWKKIKVFGGDIAQGEWDYNGGMLVQDPSTGNSELVNLHGEIKKLTVQTEDSVKDLAKTIGFTIAGGLVAGPIGLVAGYFAGGKRKEVCVLVELKDGRRFVGTMDQRIYQQMLGLQMLSQ